MGGPAFIKTVQRKVLFATLGFFIFGVFTNNASAAIYLVKNQRAYKEAVKRLQPGDKVVLANGVWRDFEIVFEAEGKKDAPISLMVETPGKVILSGQSNLRIGGNHLIVTGLTFKDGYSPTSEVISFRRNSKTLANNTRLVEVVIDGFNKPDRTEQDYWVSVFGKNNRIDHNYFAGKTNKGPTLVVRLNTPESQENNHSIDHNFFGHRPSLGGNGGETIRIGVSTYSRMRSGTIVARNFFERCDGEVEIISNKSQGNTISENVFYESRGAVVLRHGGDNVVSRNVFFGNGVEDTGGVRVINENQEVTGNYFEGLRGRKFLSALTIMNGVPDSPINRYHQVQNANVSNNSFVDISSLGFAVGSDEERSAPPVGSWFTKNLIVTDIEKPVSVFDDISGITFGDNVSNNEALAPYGAMIIKKTGLMRAANGLLYPEDAEQFSSIGAPRDLNPVKRDATGPSWYEKPAQIIKQARKTKVKKGGDALRRAVADAKPGDTLVLSAAHYALEGPLTISHDISIHGRKNKKHLTVLTSAGGTLFELHAGANLTLDNVRLAASKQNQAIIIARGDIYRGAYSLQISDVSVAPNSSGQSIPFLRADPATFAQTIVLNHVSAKGWNGPFLLMSGEGLEGWYLADDIVITDSAFEDVRGPLVDFGREGRDESTFGPRFELRNTTLLRVGSDNGAMKLSGIDGLNVRGNVFTDSGDIHIRQRVLGLPFSFKENSLQNTPGPKFLDVNGEVLDMSAGGLSQ